MENIDRPDYINKVEKLIGKGFIIALVGQRRVGKSCIMKQIVNRLSADTENNIIYIDKDDERFSYIRGHKELTSYVEERLVSDMKNYLFVDEVQNISDFELSLRSFHTLESCEIIITGSNAKILSSELSTYLSGRCIEIPIQSLDYAEFLVFHKLPDDNASLVSYLNYGGMPQLNRIGLDDQELVTDYLNSVYNTIVLKDVVEREDIRNLSLLKNLVRFIADNIGKPFSANNIARYLKSQQIGTSVKVVISYLDYLCNAFIIHRVNRYNIHGKRLLEVNDKFYFEDIGLRNVLVQGGLAQSIEKVLENAVYLHLRRLGFDIMVGCLQKTEIDFVAKSGNKVVYVQVAYLLTSAETITREFGNLKMIQDNYPKYVVSMDDLYAETDYEGIIHLHLRKFLKMKEF